VPSPVSLSPDGLSKASRRRFLSQDKLPSPVPSLNLPAFQPRASLSFIYPLRKDFCDLVPFFHHEFKINHRPPPLPARAVANLELPPPFRFDDIFTPFSVRFLTVTKSLFPPCTQIFFYLPITSSTASLSPLSPPIRHNGTSPPLHFLRQQLRVAPFPLYPFPLGGGLTPLFVSLPPGSRDDDRYPLCARQGHSHCIQNVRPRSTPFSLSSMDSHQSSLLFSPLNSPFEAFDCLPLPCISIFFLPFNPSRFVFQRLLPSIYW